MNLALIVKYVADFVRGATGIHCENRGLGIWSLACELEGKTKSVQFDDTGLYPSESKERRSELHIASEIAQELRR
jgi:hypothetical protein